MQRPDLVDVHMIETCRRAFTCRVTLNRWQIACDCPCAAVFPHSRPHKLLGHQLDGGVGPREAKAVDVVKYLASGMGGYE
jgi:hypothetical protein